MVTFIRPISYKSHSKTSRLSKFVQPHQKNGLIVQSALVVQGQLFVQSPLRVKSALLGQRQLLVQSAHVICFKEFVFCTFVTSRE